MTTPPPRSNASKALESLSSIDADISLLLHSASCAIRCLTSCSTDPSSSSSGPSSSAPFSSSRGAGNGGGDSSGDGFTITARNARDTGSDDDSAAAATDDPESNFTTHTHHYHRLLSSITVRLRREILTLQAAEIPVGIDVGTWNARNDVVGREMERELWEEGRGVVEGLKGKGKDKGRKLC
ncbi:mediator complex, subunit Med11 [Pyronema omphalodes]|nr:mediator complex, subunit Med11 [Pyronema omphalodes]